MRIINRTTKWFVLSAAFMGAFSFCNQGATEAVVAPFPYSLSAARVVALPQKLDEISGLIYNPTAKTLQAVQDEEGALYAIALGNKVAISAMPFGDAGDYEDLTLVNNQVYILESNGNITALGIDDSSKVQRFFFPQKSKKNDFETLLYLPGTGKLLLLCKTCKGGKKKGVAAWEFDPQTGSYSLSPFAFDIGGAKGLSDSKGLQPSGVAVHPQTGDYYFLSSVNALLVVTDASGTVKSTQALDPKLYTQPEGICFLPSGELVISNEKGSSSSATLLIASPVK